MADVTLRESLDLMRSFLRAGHLAEAFALGRHILHFYPKHIETYTVLAQVSLATNDLAGANDLLRRVLSSDPENVVALAGMALINQAQDKQGEALWYLERAYEIQPSNDELRGELLRLREQYYGTAPGRVELTPGALARVYARQGQYAQAIGEYRRLLRSESRRYDAQVGLAETLYRAGRTDEAAQVAQAVMSEAPYALKPNLILGALWTENAVPEGQQFLQRAHQLDPEHRVARQLLGERFDGADPPRLPEMGESSIAPVALPAPIQVQPSETIPSEHDTAYAALLLGEIERAQEPDVSVSEPFAAGPLTPAHPGSAPDRAESRPEMTAAQVASAALAVNLAAEALGSAGTDTDSVMFDAEPVATSQINSDTSDTTLAEIAVAEGVETEPAKPAAPADRSTRGKPKNISTEAIAAAAAALATSIALDKSNQPAPTRRTHSAIPKVRPIIPGAAEKLPSWLYLSPTPANPNASFDVPEVDQDEFATVLPESDRSDWLVQAQAASENEPVSVSAQEELPDWLRPAVVAGVVSSIAREAQESTQPPPTDAAGESENEQSPTAKPATAAGATAELPEWLREPKAAQQPQAPVVPPPPADDAPALERSNVPEPLLSALDTQQAGSESDATGPIAAVGVAAVLFETARDETSPADIASPLETVAAVPTLEESPAAETTAIASESAPPAAEEERPTVQQQPDSAAMLQMARDKRDSGDLKGALELYERVLHRRPNHIEQVIADLQDIVKTGEAPLSANRLLGEAYAMVGRFKESLEQYRTAMGKHPARS